MNIPEPPLKPSFYDYKWRLSDNKKYCQFLVTDEPFPYLVLYRWRCFSGNLFNEENYYLCSYATLRSMGNDHPFGNALKIREANINVKHLIDTIQQLQDSKETSNNT